MPAVIYRQPDGSARCVDVPVGISLMRGAIENQIDGIEAECGGSAACGTCHVYVDPAFAGQLPPPQDNETEMLAGVAAEPRPTSRLSCQIIMTAALDGLTVELPERQS